MESSGRRRKPGGGLWNARDGPRDAGPAWISDSDTEHCALCSVRFTTLTRRHHCRNCGDIFCGLCTGCTHALPDYDYTKEVRVCRPCKEELLHSETELVFHRLDEVPVVSAPFDLRRFGHRHLRYVNKVRMPVIDSVVLSHEALKATRVAAIVDRYLFICTPAGVVRRVVGLDTVERIYQRDYTKRGKFFVDDLRHRLNVLVKHRGGEVFFTLAVESADGLRDKFPGTVQRIAEALTGTDIPTLKVPEDSRIADYFEPAAAASADGPLSASVRLSVPAGSVAASGAAAHSDSGSAGGGREGRGSFGEEGLCQFVGKRYADVVAQLFPEDADEEPGDGGAASTDGGGSAEGGGRAAQPRTTLDALLSQPDRRKEILQHIVRDARRRAAPGVKEHWAGAELRKIFTKHEPIRLNTVGSLLARHKGREEVLLERVLRTYEPEQTIRREVQKILKNAGRSDSYIDTLLSEHQQREGQLLDALLGRGDERAAAQPQPARSASLPPFVEEANGAPEAPPLVTTAVESDGDGDVDSDSDDDLVEEEPSAARAACVACSGCGAALVAGAGGGEDGDDDAAAVAVGVRPGFFWRGLPAVLAELPPGAAVAARQARETEEVPGVGAAAAVRCAGCGGDAGARIVSCPSNQEAEGCLLLHEDAVVVLRPPSPPPVPLPLPVPPPEGTESAQQTPPPATGSGGASVPVSELAALASLPAGAPALVALLGGSTDDAAAAAEAGDDAGGDDGAAAAAAAAAEARLADFFERLREEREGGDEGGLEGFLRSVAGEGRRRLSGREVQTVVPAAVPTAAEAAACAHPAAAATRVSSEVEAAPSGPQPHLVHGNLAFRRPLAAVDACGGARVRIYKMGPLPLPLPAAEVAVPDSRRRPRALHKVGLLVGPGAAGVALTRCCVSVAAAEASSFFFPEAQTGFEVAAGDAAGFFAATLALQHLLGVDGVAVRGAAELGGDAAACPRLNPALRRLLRRWFDAWCAAAAEGRRRPRLPSPPLQPQPRSPLSDAAVADLIGSADDYEVRCFSPSLELASRRRRRGGAGDGDCAAALIYDPAGLEDADEPVASVLLGGGGGGGGGVPSAEEQEARSASPARKPYWLPAADHLAASPSVGRAASVPLEVLLRSQEHDGRQLLL
eukprot:Rhum_TRINITY_DN12631_c0_g1::Rhum_TRINITY_DN12631_c0_g1_i1::g.53334::m.53334